MSDGYGWLPQLRRCAKELTGAACNAGETIAGGGVHRCNRWICARELPIWHQRRRGAELAVRWHGAANILCDVLLLSDTWMDLYDCR